MGTPGADTRAQHDALAAVYAPVALAVLLVVLVALVVPLVRNRSSRGREPSQRESSVRLELGYAVVLAVIAGVLVWRTFVVTERVDAGSTRSSQAASGTPALTVGVDAAKWNWRFSYPGGVVEQGTGARTPDLPTLVVPSGELVRFRLRALDVVHAFWIPATRYKFDAIPGRVNVFDLRFEPGRDYERGLPRCSEFCGQYHEQMRFRVDVRSPAAFAAWLRERQAQVAR